MKMGTSPLKNIPFLLTFILISCSFAAGSRANIAAKPENPSPPSGPVVDQSIREQENEEFLEAHNKVRAQMGLPNFTWDEKLEAFAYEYGSKRSQDCELVHSDSPYGENLFWGGGKLWKPEEMVKLWVGEDVDYDAKSNTCQQGKMCGHYTQIVWRDSVRLGCVKILCQNGDSYGVCSYDPPGNYEGQSPFDHHDA